MLPFASQPAFRSVWKAYRCLAHHDDRPPYSEPGEPLVSVAALEHPIRISRGLEFGVAAMRVAANAYSGATIRPALRGAKVKFKRGWSWGARR